MKDEDKIPALSTQHPALMNQGPLIQQHLDPEVRRPAIGYRLRRCAPASLTAIGYVMLLALAHGLLYAWLVPLWQKPDEPMLFEYAALAAELGRAPGADDRSPALEARILESLRRNGFWEERIGRAPEPPPATLAEAQALVFMPRQVGGDPPAYFALAAIPLRLTAGWGTDTQAYLLRGLGALALPLAALGAYLAGRELLRGQGGEGTGGRGDGGTRGQGDHIPYSSPPLSPSERSERIPPSASAASGPLPLAAALLVALHPMAAFMSGAVSNDGLALALGALLCWLLLRGLRGGLSLRWLAALGLAAGGALLVKRTAIPYLLVAGALGALGILLGGLRNRPGARNRPGLRNLLAPLLGNGFAAASRVAGGRWRSGRSPATRHPPQQPATGFQNTILGLRNLLLFTFYLFPFTLLLAWASTQVDQRAAFGWYDPRSGRPAPTSGAAIPLRAGDEIIQPLPALGVARLHNDALRFGARVWGDGPASGRLVVDTGLHRQEYPFQAGAAGQVEMGAYVSRLAPRVWVGVIADSGSLYVDDLWASAAGLPGDLLLNGGAGWPALRPAAPLEALVGYLRADELLWSLRSGAWLQRMPVGDWARWLFVSFWGEFGWMDRPFVRGSWWEPALIAVCAAGVIASMQKVQGTRHKADPPASAPPSRCVSFVPFDVFRDPGAPLALLLLLALVPLLINAMADPNPIQQGRYLLPVLPALALLLAGGAEAWLGRWRRWPLLWAAFWLALAGAAIISVIGYYIV